MKRDKGKGSTGGQHQEPAIIKERTKCPQCRGSSGHSKCPYCEGAGWIEGAK